MTPEERAVLIDRLARENAESEARIAELQRKREENPLAEIAIDARETDDDSGLRFGAVRGEPIGSPAVSAAPSTGVIYRDYNGNAPATAAEDGPAPSYDEAYPPYGDLMQIISQFVV